MPLPTDPNTLVNTIGWLLSVVLVAALIIGTAYYVVRGWLEQHR